MRFGRKYKLALRFMGSFEVLECIGKVAYRLTLLTSIDRIHNMFHVSLSKYISDSTYVLKDKDIKLEDNLAYEEHLIQILDKRVMELRHKHIPLIKVL